MLHASFCFENQNRIFIFFSSSCSVSSATLSFIMHRLHHFPLLLLLSTTLLFLPSGTWSLLVDPQPPKQKPRRDFLKSIAFSIVGSTLLPTTNSNAACLPGDASAECIGVYKIPLDAATQSPLLNTPEALKLNAPDVKYVKPIEAPKSVVEAVEILRAQRMAANDIKDVIWAGRLEEAGIKVLNLVPRVTLAGNQLLDYVRRVYQDDTPINQIRLTKSEGQLSEMVVNWSQLDVEIGQALRGHLGVSAVAQLYLLQTLQEAIVSMDEFMLFMESSSGLKNKL